MRLVSVHKKSLSLALPISTGTGMCTSKSLKTEGWPQRAPIQLSHSPEGAVRTGGAKAVVSFLIMTNGQVRTRVCVDWSSQLQTPQPASEQGSCGLVAYSTSAECRVTSTCKHSTLDVCLQTSISWKYEGETLQWKRSILGEGSCLIFIKLWSLKWI